jgi:AcrR family transcriptional regulator
MTPPATRDKEGKIELILNTFSELVKREGYDSLSTRHIAREAGISVGIIYHYFPSGKHSIAMAFMERLTQGIFNPEMFMGATGEEGLKELYSEFIRGHLKAHRDNIELHRAIDQAILANPKVREQNSAIIKRNLAEAALHLMKRGMFEGAQNTQVISNFLFNFQLIEAVVHRHLLVDSFFETDEELVEGLSMMLLGRHMMGARDRRANQD